MSHLTYLVLCLAGLLSGVTATAESKKTTSMLISRYSGVVGIAQIGDSEAAILSRVKWQSKKSPLPKNHALTKIRFSHMVAFPESGIRAYFRNDKVALLEIQDPFLGEIQGTRLRVFLLTNTKQEKWEDVLQAELGRQPRARYGNGKLNSEAFFYDWGDIAFNASGPNEIAVYRDPEIAKYRQTNFGRKLEMWSH